LAERPSSSRRDRPIDTRILRKTEEKYFAFRSLTGFLCDCPTGKSNAARIYESRCGTGVSWRDRLSDGSLAQCDIGTESSALSTGARLTVALIEQTCCSLNSFAYFRVMAASTALAGALTNL
jgi:hypothetical protein